ncbi:MAG: hypothetical protein WCL11_29600 [Verrucomicrobiota bacterium]
MKTTLSGLLGAITGILSYIASIPPSLQDQVPQLFPEQYRGTIGLWLRVIAGLSLVYFAKSAKDAASSTAGPARTPFLSILLICAFALTSCAWQQAHQSQINATGSVIAKRAASIALNLVISSAINQLDREHKGNYLDSMALGVRTLQGADVIQSSDIQSLVGIWTPQKMHWDELASNLGTLYDSAKTGNLTKDTALLESIAVGLQAAARAP